MGISVSRVGGKAQVKAMKDITGMLRLDLAAFRELEAFAQLGTDLDKATQAQLDRGNRMVEILKQPQYQPMEVFDQVVSIFAGASGLLDDIDARDVADFETRMHEYLRANQADLMAELRNKKELDDQLKNRFKKAIAEFKEDFAKDKSPQSTVHSPQQER